MNDTLFKLIFGGCLLQRSHGKNVPDKNDFNQIKVNTEKKTGDSLSALNKSKVIQESSWLDAA